MPLSPRPTRAASPHPSALAGQSPILRQSPPMIAHRPVKIRPSSSTSLAMTAILTVIRSALLPQVRQTAASRSTPMVQSLTPRILISMALIRSLTGSATDRVALPMQRSASRLRRSMMRQPRVRLTRRQILMPMWLLYPSQADLPMLTATCLALPQQVCPQASQ